MMGNCSVCGFRHKILKDGITIGTHKVFSGSDGRVCLGSRRPYKLYVIYDANDSRINLNDSNLR
jgi:hypothetical protein